jgi:cell division protein FtsL
MTTPLLYILITLAITLYIVSLTNMFIVMYEVNKLRKQIEKDRTSDHQER